VPGQNIETKQSEGPHE